MTWLRRIVPYGWRLWWWGLPYRLRIRFLGGRNQARYNEGYARGLGHMAEARVQGYEQGYRQGREDERRRLMPQGMTLREEWLQNHHGPGVIPPHTLVHMPPPPHHRLSDDEYWLHRYGMANPPPQRPRPSLPPAQAESVAQARLATLLTPEQFDEYLASGTFTDAGAQFAGERVFGRHPHAIIVNGIPYCLQVNPPRVPRPPGDIFSGSHMQLPPTDHVIHRLLMWRHDRAFVLRTAISMLATSDPPLPRPGIVRFLERHQ